MSDEVAERRLDKFVESDDTRILSIPPKIFQPHRILILKILYLHGDAEFRELKQDLQITDGNLASHLRTLEEEGYLDVHKEIIQRKPRTAYDLTKKGKDALRQFKENITKVIQFEL